MKAALLGLAIASLAQDDAAPLLCQADLSSVSGQTIAWVNVMANGRFERVSSNVFLRINDLDVQWKLDRGGRPSEMLMFRYWLTLPSEFGEPTAVLAVVNNTKIPVSDQTKPREGAVVEPSGRSTLFERVMVTEKTVPNIYGAQTLAFEATNGEGKVARRLVSLPNWRWFDRQTRIAFRAAERARKKHNCGPSIYI